MKITIIGCGIMGSGLARRLSPHHGIFLYDALFEKTEQLEKEGHGVACRQLGEALQQSDIVILAVKPQVFDEAADLICNEPHKGQMLLSLLTGTLIATIKKKFPCYRVVRMMPNLPMIYGEGLIGLAVDHPLTVKERQQLVEISEPLGKIYWLNEKNINAFTSLAGSGPAFVLTMIESMVEAGIEMGFSAQDSQEIVMQMVKGSQALLDKSKKHPGELKWQIASPGGTTIAGLKRLEELAVRGGIINTFLEAYERAVELS